MSAGYPCSTANPFRDGMAQGCLNGTIMIHCKNVLGGVYKLAIIDSSERWVTLVVAGGTRGWNTKSEDVDWLEIPVIFLGQIRLHLRSVLIWIKKLTNTRTTLSSVARILSTASPPVEVDGNSRRVSLGLRGEYLPTRVHSLAGGAGISA